MSATVDFAEFGEVGPPLILDLRLSGFPDVLAFLPSLFPPNLNHVVADLDVFHDVSEPPFPGSR